MFNILVNEEFGYFLDYQDYDNMDNGVLLTKQHPPTFTLEEAKRIVAIYKDRNIPLKILSVQCHEQNKNLAIMG